MIQVSVIMPCYNASQYIGEAIQSVQSQSFIDWELLIVDDGSTDDSAQIVQGYVARDTRIRLIQQSNSGACRARNNGIEHARGEFIKFLDADDLLESNCLQDQVCQIQSLQLNQIPFGDYYNIDKDGKIVSEYKFNKHQELKNDQVFFFFSEWRILISAPLHRTCLLRKINGFDESLKRGQESDMHLRLALADVEFVYRPCITFRYRDHNASTRISEQYHEGTQVLQQFRRQRTQMVEQQLKERYDIVPAKYNPYFAKMWFSYAREWFSKGDTAMGNQYMRRACQYGLYTRFQRSYNWIGGIVGFELVEKILQLRLKLLHKK